MWGENLKTSKSVSIILIAQVIKNLTKSGLINENKIRSQISSNQRPIIDQNAE